ncbi:MAG: PAS domain S-box protein [Halodesulfurarchaeum sp.]|nr:PAS domain S-box protein [Halodesulfurarchaeum sp.]
MGGDHESFLDDLLGAVQDVITLVDDEGAISYVSPAVESVTGHDRSALQGESVLSLVHPEDRDRVASRFADLVAGERNSENPISHRIESADEQWQWVETIGRNRATTEFDDHLLTTRDRAKDRDLFELLTEASANLLYFKDTDHRLVHCGRSFAEVLDAEPTELIGKRTDELWLPALAEDVLARERRVLEGETVLDRERKLTHADGTEHWYSVNKIPRYDESGTVIGFFAIDRKITERKAQEAKLERYRQAVESSSDMLAASNRDHEYLFANERYREFYDIPPETDLSGVRNQSVIGGGNFEEIESSLEQVYEGERVSFETTRQNAAGEVRALDIRFYPLRDEDGTVVGDVTAMRDVTKRKERERELEEKSERLDLAVEGADLGIWDWDMQSDTVTRNGQWGAMLGYEPEEIANEIGGWERLLHPDDREPHDRALEGHIEGEKDLYTVDYRLKTAEGEWKWIRNIGKVMERDEDGNPVRSVGIHQDVDEQKRAEQERKESRKRLRQIIDLVPDPIFVKNRDGEYLLANEAVAALFGRKPADMIGKTERELGMGSATFRRYREEDLGVIDSGESLVIPERQARTPEGNVLTFQTVLIPYEPVGSDAEGVLGYARNMTERKEYEEQIEVQRDTLEILNQIVRHDIRNDLQLVVSYTELIEDHVDEEGREWAKTVLEAARNAIEITQTARDVADVVLSSETELEPRSVRTVLEAEIETVGSNFEQAAIETDGSIPDATILADGMLESVFRNLLQNAIVHNDEDEPTVTVSATAGEQWITVRFVDNGPGIPEDRKETIFEKGEQGLDSDGTGLGLYLVNTLVDRYGGSLRIEDNEPKGSVFVVELPLES